MASEDRGITFDEMYRIRVFDPDKQRQTKELQEACESFTSKISELDKVVRGLLEQIGAQAQKIENEKLRAMGQRLKATMEPDVRKRKLGEQAAVLAEKQQELDDIGREYESLLKVRHEQELMIAKITDAGS
ncbi:hypothetical protein KFL_001080230 [Klebsormidium nitens]|uniref:Intraflagellar transport protein 20 n=1 Tax=Klebsormidium nitens TaxID=105231 RepID=A0A1Y1I0N5_KLENI|nr:hypothetical protein KFL_001080230 [Klebsormidium nitens]|eukprot:GAQ82347.1 hypothetical protein KFL_001080230 [Klebsormidium nitens]